jgi:hypothetical protein
MSLSAGTHYNRKVIKSMCIFFIEENKKTFSFIKKAPFIIHRTEKYMKKKTLSVSLFPFHNALCNFQKHTLETQKKIFYHIE